MNERQLCTGNWHDELPWISTTAFLGRLCHQGRSQELEMGGAKLLGEGSGGRLRPKGGAHAP